MPFYPGNSYQTRNDPSTGVQTELAIRRLAQADAAQQMRGQLEAERKRRAFGPVEDGANIFNHLLALAQRQEESKANRALAERQMSQQGDISVMDMLGKLAVLEGEQGFRNRSENRLDAQGDPVLASLGDKYRAFKEAGNEDEANKVMASLSARVAFLKSGQGQEPAVYFGPSTAAQQAAAIKSQEDISMARATAGFASPSNVADAIIGPAGAPVGLGTRGRLGGDFSTQAGVTQDVANGLQPFVEKAVKAGANLNDYVDQIAREMLSRPQSEVLGYTAFDTPPEEIVRGALSMVKSRILATYPGAVANPLSPGAATGGKTPTSADAR